MATPTIVLGDTTPYIVPLTLPETGASFVINPLTDQVRAALVSINREIIYTETPIEVDPDAVGGDWSESTVIIQFPRSATIGLPFQGKARLEVQVTFNYADPDKAYDRTAFIDVNLVKGNIA